MDLSARDRAILDFERTWRHVAGAKSEGIRSRLHLSPTRYYTILSTLLDNPAAMAYDPLTVKRAQRIRSDRRRNRLEGRRADPGSR